jgi:hypothetical protein
VPEATLAARCALRDVRCAPCALRAVSARLVPILRGS